MPNDQGNFLDTVNDVVTSQIGRVVTFVVTPILLPVVGALAFWLQNKIGIDMNPTEATAYIAAIVTGGAGVIWKWLHNRGEYERSVIELHKLYEAGNQLVQQAPIDPTARKLN